MKKCSKCQHENIDEAVCCRHCGELSFEPVREQNILTSKLSEWRRRWFVCWMAIAAFGISLFFIGQAPWYQRLVGVLIFQIFIGGWFLLIKFSQDKAMENTASGEEFRTGRPPTWRVMLYALIAMAIPLYFFYPHLNELQPGLKFLFWIIIFAIGAFVVFFGIILPWMVKRNKSWIIEHRGLVLRVLYVALTLNALLKLWDIIEKFHKH